ncbi:MAG: acyl--CoA ligase [Chloroflexi bacterium]|nr:acyl--CoA ligase [Chloroflexota bacterium]
MNPARGITPMPDGLVPSTISDTLHRNALRHPDRAAVIQRGISGSRHELSYRQLNARANHFASGLQELGVGRGNIVMVSSGNRVQCLVAYYGTLRCGATFAAVAPSLTSREAEVLASVTNPQVVLAEDWSDEGVKALGSTADIRLAFTNDTTASIGGIQTMEEISSIEPASGPQVAINETDPALIVFTSGTEELPKAVVIPHRNFMIATTPSWIIDRYVLASDIFLLLAPIYTMAGIGTVTNLINVGATAILLPKLQTELVLEVIESEGVTNTSQTPTFFRRLVRAPTFKQADFSSLRQCHIYGGSIPSEAVQQISAKNPALEWAVYWGQSELTQLGISGTFRSLEQIPDQDVRWIGTPMQAVEIRVVDEDGRDSEIGELLCRSPAIMAGYHRQPDLTAEVVVNGWLHTGDIVRVDEDLNVFFLDRRKDIIKTGGMNVSSAEVEDVLRHHPMVNDAAVVGCPDPEWSEIVCAFVEMVDGTTWEEESIRNYCSDQLAPYKRPKIYETVDSLPTDDQGKVRKRELRARLLD